MWAKVPITKLSGGGVFSFLMPWTKNKAIKMATFDTSEGEQSFPIPSSSIRDMVAIVEVNSYGADYIILRISNPEGPPFLFAVKAESVVLNVHREWEKNG